MKVNVYDLKGEKKSAMDVSKGWENVPVSEQAVKDSVVYHLANKRRGTVCVKNRSEVDLTKHKPWRQKGTGRARVGTASNPLWRKGGKAFGPRPREFSFSLPKKVRQLALKSVLAEKVRGNNIVLIDNIELDKPKTKTIVSLFKNLECTRKPIIITEEKNRNIGLSVRNIPGADFSRVEDLSTYQVLNHDKLVITKKAWTLLEKKILGNNDK